MASSPCQVFSLTQQDHRGRRQGPHCGQSGSWSPPSSRHQSPRRLPSLPSFPPLDRGHTWSEPAQSGQSKISSPGKKALDSTSSHLSCPTPEPWQASSSIAEEDHGAVPVDQRPERRVAGQARRVPHCHSHRVTAHPQHTLNLVETSPRVNLENGGGLFEIHLQL